MLARAPAPAVLDKRPRLFLKSLEMISELKPAEYRLLVESSPVMIWRSGVDAKCDYFNETWLAFTGRALEEELGDGWAKGVHPDDLERCVAHYLDHFHRRQPFEMEYRLRRKDGVYRWIFDRGVPSYDDSGRFLGFIGSCVDVDDRRRAQALREKRDEQQLANAHDFERWILAIVSHDIRNPLGTIAGSAELLSRAVAEPVMRKSIDRIVRGVARIAHIVSDLLDLSRERHGGGIPVTLARADLREICSQVVDEVASIVPDRSIAIDCNGDDLCGVWDANRIAQAMSNLVANAVQHSPPGSPVRVQVRSADDRVVVEVHNEGHIAAEQLPALFDPFRSRVPKSSHADGLGLGLFIAKAIARAHQGTIEVDSAADRGTTFSLVLPRQAGAAA